METSNAQVRQRIWPYIVFMIAFAGGCVAISNCHGYGAEVPRSVPQYELVIVRLAEGEHGAVLAADFTPVDVFEGSSGFCFTGRPGRYVVLITSPEKLTPHVLQITGTVPPDPGPQPPEPQPPTPGPVVPNVRGYGKWTYDQAKLVGDQAACVILAEIYASAASGLAAKSGDIIDDLNAATAGIKAQTNERLTSRSKWITFAEGLKQKMGQSWTAGTRDREGWVAILNEISTAFRMVR